MMGGMRRKSIVHFMFICVAILTWPGCSPDIRNKIPAGENIICFGDSLTYGTGASDDMDYPARLERILDRPVVNAGRPGDTTEDALARVERDVLTKSPRIVLITIGGNDLKNGVAKDAAFQNLGKIIELIQDEGALVVVGGIRFGILDKGYGKAYEAVCREKGAILIPHILKGIMGKQDKMSDPIHPNDNGYELMAEKFYAVIKPYI
jgi:acyl-CoA thioesterase I